MKLSFPGKEQFRFLDLLIVILSVYVLIAIIVDMLVPLQPELHHLLMLIDDGICMIFLYDFLTRFFRAENKLRFMRWGWVDLVSSIPALPFVRYGRLFRLIKLFRILRAFRSIKVLAHYVFKNRATGTFTTVGIITILVVIFSSISVLLVESAPTSNIKTAEDAIWWSLETVTTIGYGDRYPVTTEGRMIGVVLMFVGVGLFGTFTAYVASWFTAGNQPQEKTGNIQSKE